jgi:hypothetical protein
VAVIDDETAAALRESASKPDAGYQILWRDGSVILLIFDDEDGDEATMLKFGMPREVARRMGKRLVIAAERARREKAAADFFIKKPAAS